MEERSTDYDARYFLAHIEQWILAVMDIGNDICELERADARHSQLIMAAAAQVPVNIERIQQLTQENPEGRLQDSMRSAYKGALFLVALNKVARWGRKLIKAFPEFAAPVEAYLASFGEGKDLRDIHEHDDEYFTGGGRNPKKYIVGSPEQGFVSNASGRSIIGDEIFLGHQLSVQAMMQAVDKLYGEVVAPHKPQIPPPLDF